MLPILMIWIVAAELLPKDIVVVALWDTFCLWTPTDPIPSHHQIFLESLLNQVMSHVQINWVEKRAYENDMAKS